MLSRSLLKDVVPPIVVRWIGRVRGAGTRFEAATGSWAEARERSSGYDDGAILEAVVAATRKVVDGAAPYERDSVLFSTPQYSYPVLAAVALASLELGRPLSVLDVGGSLGSSYRELRAFFGEALPLDHWHVVEQPSFAQAGAAEFQTEGLRFFDSVSDAIASSAPDIVLLSSVLQYVPSPTGLLEEVHSLGAEYIVIDRTIVHKSDRHRLYIQHVPKSIYSASYPCWSISEDELVGVLSVHYEMQSVFDSIEFKALREIDAEFKGFIFKRRQHG